MTAVEKCILAFIGAGTCLFVGMMLISMSNTEETTGGWALVGGVLFLTTFPLALVGLFWLIRAATQRDT